MGSVGQRHDPVNILANWAPGALLMIAMVFGGGIEGIGDSVVYGVAAITAGTVLLHGVPVPRGQAIWAMDLTILAALGWCLLQLVPLPVLFTMSSGAREAILAELHEVGLSPAWAAISLDLLASIRATLAATVFAVIWWSMRRATAVSRINTMKAAIVAGVFMALLATWQAMAKPDTTGGAAFFMNRNHLATLFTMLLPFAFTAAHRGGNITPRLALAAWYSAAGLLILGIASTLSRAGAVLAVLTLLASLVFLIWPNIGDRRWRWISGAFVTSALTAAAASTAGKLHERFTAGLAGDLRWEYYLRSWRLLEDYFPWGSGIGTFGAVFQRGETVTSLLSPVWGPGEYIFALYAHNEPLQVGIEAGLPGLLLVAALVTIIAKAIFATLRRGERTSAWRRAAAISVAVPLLHSLVDSPLRTLACLGLLAAAIAMLLAHETGPDSRMNRGVAP